MDDAVFMGEWTDDSIHNIVRMLHCFHLAYGLKINPHIIKLHGIDVPIVRVEEVAEQIGCSTMKTHFTYLDLPMGGNMHRVEA